MVTWTAVLFSLALLATTEGSELSTASQSVIFSDWIIDLFVYLLLKLLRRPLKKKKKDKYPVTTTFDLFLLCRYFLTG